MVARAGRKLQLLRASPLPPRLRTAADADAVADVEVGEEEEVVTEVVTEAVTPPLHRSQAHRASESLLYKR